MRVSRRVWAVLGLLLLVGAASAAPLDPKGKLHIPIGIPNTLDTLKTFVEPEGCFSPGVGSYGIYFWLYDRKSGKLFAATLDGTQVEHGLDLGEHPGTGLPIPWCRWRADGLELTVELCQAERESPQGRIQAVGVRVELQGTLPIERELSLIAALRPLGPAGWKVCALSADGRRDALLVDGHPALVAAQPASAAGVLATDTIGDEVTAGRIPKQQQARSEGGDCSGALRFDCRLLGNNPRSWTFVCPVLPGRRAVGHQWDGTSAWAQFDLAELNPTSGGQLQPDPGLDFYRRLSAEELFRDAGRYWLDFFGKVSIAAPDPRWAEAFRAIAAHVAIAMNEGAPDVAVVNYNVFNRDGVYVANILQKSGRFDLAAAAIDYFLAHPFNGRVEPEADNPGQILWIMGEHWRLTHHAAWLARVHPAAKKVAALIEYYRTTPAPHWVGLASLDFGPALPAADRRLLKPGACDGHHPEYTEAFDIAGLRAAALLAEAAQQPAEAAHYRQLAETLWRSYDARFGPALAQGYGSYCVLWPCRLYPFADEKAHAAFASIGGQKPAGWRYFPLARSHQGLLTGQRAAGFQTLAQHLDHEQMRGWYVFDEGGRSGSGGWRRLRTTWNGDVAMPHGWAIAEFWLLLRDALVYEDGDRLVLLAGVPDQWLAEPVGRGQGITVKNLPTAFGPCSFSYVPLAKRASTPETANLAPEQWKTTVSAPYVARFDLNGTAAPPGGFVLRLPAALQATITADGKPLDRAANGDVRLPPETRVVQIRFAEK